MSLRRKNINGLICILTCVLIACAKDESDHQIIPSSLEKIAIPKGLPEIVFPSDNAFTPQRWELGKKLFYDKRLSIDSTISCASCHQQKFGFADNQPFTAGVLGRAATRNAPSLVNVAYHPYFTREGGVPTLEMQILIPIAEHNEFGFNLVRLVERLSKDSTYQNMARTAYNRNLDAFSITRAISTFERSLISGDSKYDIFVAGKASLTSLEKEGMNLFFSEKTQCSSCHSGFNFTNYAFENNGLYEIYEDAGRMRLTNKMEDLALFKVPSLRMIGVTAPYMHDGSLANLFDVIEHYNQGGKDHPNKNKKLKKLGLSLQEKNALVAFLNTLTDKSFLSNSYFSEN
jgi:cytochrome c peroxidase